MTTQILARTQAENEQSLDDLIATVHAQYPDALAYWGPKDGHDVNGEPAPAPRPDSRSHEAEAWIYREVTGRGSFLFLDFEWEDGTFDPRFSEVRICQFDDDDSPNVFAELSRFNISLMKAVELLSQFWSENAGDRDVYVRMVPGLHAELIPLVNGERYCSNEEACALVDRDLGHIKYDPITQKTYLQPLEGNAVGIVISLSKYKLDNFCNSSTLAPAVFKRWQRDGRRQVGSAEFQYDFFADDGADVEQPATLTFYNEGFSLLPRLNDPGAFEVIGPTQSYKTSFVATDFVHSLKADPTLHVSYFIPLAEQPKEMAKVALAVAKHIGLDPAELRKRFHIVPELPPMSEQANVDWLIGKAIGEHKSQLCAIDTWFYARHGIREQDSAAADIVISLTDKLGRFGCTPVIIDHASTDDPTQARGNRAKGNAIAGRVVLTVDRKADTVAAAYTKLKGWHEKASRKVYYRVAFDGPVVMPKLLSADEYRALRTPKAKDEVKDIENGTAVDERDQMFVAIGADASPTETEREQSQSERKRERDKIQKRRWRAKQSDKSDMSDPLFDA